MKNKSIKNYNFFQRYIYVIISFILLIILVAFVFKAFLFLKSNFDVTFVPRQSNEWIHFNIQGLKEINNKVNCNIK